jgi:hypothetical protein
MVMAPCQGLALSAAKVNAEYKSPQGQKTQINPMSKECVQEGDACKGRIRWVTQRHKRAAPPTIQPG